MSKRILGCFSVAGSIFVLNATCACSDDECDVKSEWHTCKYYTSCSNVACMSSDKVSVETRPLI